MNHLRVLYAAFVDADEAQLDRIMGDRFPKKMLDAWQRVADAAEGRWNPAPPRRPSQWQRKPAWELPEITPCDPDDAGKVFCGQCDKLVKAAEALACGSKFCKARGA